MAEENKNEVPPVEATSDEEEWEDDDDYSEIPPEEPDESPEFTPSVGVHGGMNVTDTQLNHYNTQVDEEAVKAIRAEWRKKRWFGARKLTPVSAFLMVGVCAFIPWYIWGTRQDLEYFFSSSRTISAYSA